MSSRRPNVPEAEDAGRAQPEQYEEAWQRALRLLARQERTEADLLSRLDRAGFDSPTRQAVLERLRELALVDDERFARAWLGGRSGPQALGKRRLRSELVRRGVAPVVVHRVLAEISGEAEQLRANAVACHLWSRLGPQPAQGWQSRLYQALARRGFGPETSKAALRRAAEDAEQDNGW